MISMGFMAFYAPRGAETRAGLSRHLLAPPFGRPGRTTRCLQSAHCCSEGVNEKLTPHRTASDPSLAYRQCIAPRVLQLICDNMALASRRLLLCLCCAGALALSER
jgi:hypothetical protein